LKLRTPLGQTRLGHLALGGAGHGVAFLRP
jgi:hypothetical protein